VRQYIKEQFQVVLSSRTCLNYLHRLGFVLKRPKKRLTKANAEKREAFVGEYVILRSEAQAGKAQIFFVDEAHFRADVELRSQWVLRGAPALVDSSSPRLGEKATYYSAVCLETGEVEVLSIEGNSNAETSVAFLKQLREKYPGPLIVIWDNGPAHRGEAMRTYLKTPNLQLRLVALPAYSPDFNPDEAIWEWVREEATANTCFGTAAKVFEKVDAFFVSLTKRAAEVMQRCRRELQALADHLILAATQAAADLTHVDSTLRLVYQSRWQHCHPGCRYCSGCPKQRPHQARWQWPEPRRTAVFPMRAYQSTCFFILSFRDGQRGPKWSRSRWRHCRPANRYW
jgi:transposase